MNAPDAPFDQPWQAQLFAMTVALNESDIFSWSEWSRQFGPRVQNASTNMYWTHWAEALIALLENKGIATCSEVEELKELWQMAAQSTPHGQAIELPTPRPAPPRE